jgi:hypothetical protein
MGMFDEVYCYATLPDGRDPRGTCFQTKSFPDPCMCRYRTTSAGRLIDSAGNDLEPDGYITFYRVRYGLASFRWFHTPSFLLDDSDEESDASKADVEPGK